MGILTAQCAFVRGAKRVILIDNVAYRLNHAQKTVPKVEVVNFDDQAVADALREMVPGGAFLKKQLHAT